MTQDRNLIWALTILGVVTLTGGVVGLRSPSAWAKEPPLQTVSHVEVERYLGTWYEIASFPASFQRNCICTTAHYSLQKRGDLTVTNRCLRTDRELKETISRGRAWVVDPETNAKLKVQFFWPFAGKYWIIDLDENYQYAVVSEPNRRYLWILSREPQMDEQVYEGILERLHTKGFDLSRLVRNSQSPDPRCWYR